MALFENKTLDKIVIATFATATMLFSEGIINKAYGQNPGNFSNVTMQVNHEGTQAGVPDAAIKLGHEAEPYEEYNETTDINGQAIFNNVYTEVKGVPSDKNPLEYKLEQNYPNPFNPATRIQFSTAETGHVQLGVYNVKGELVKMLVDRVLPAGKHAFDWGGVNDQGMPVAAGVYLARLNTEDYQKTTKMIVMEEEPMLAVPFKQLQ